MDSVNLALTKKLESLAADKFIKEGQTYDRTDVQLADWFNQLQVKLLEASLIIEKINQVVTKTEPQPKVPYKTKLNGKHVMNFGKKYAGRLLEDVPLGFWQWFVENVSGQEELKEYAQSRLMATRQHEDEFDDNEDRNIPF